MRLLQREIVNKPSNVGSTRARLLITPVLRNLYQVIDCDSCVFRSPLPTAQTLQHNMESEMISKQETTPRCPAKEQIVVPPLPSFRHDPQSEMVTLLTFKPVRFPVGSPQQQENQKEQVKDHPQEFTETGMKSGDQLLLLKEEQPIQRGSTPSTIPGISFDIKFPDDSNN